MGESMEITAKQWQISRQEQDELALASHRNAAKAYAEGFYDDLLVEYLGVKRDNNLRTDTSLEQLAKLKPVFDRSPTGTMTAGNSTPLTDGASGVLICSEDWARRRSLPVQRVSHLRARRRGRVRARGGLADGARVRGAAMLDRAGLSLQDFDFYEIHEAFASQVLATLKAWESEKFCRERLKRDRPLGPIDRSKLNIKAAASRSAIRSRRPARASSRRSRSCWHEHGRGRGLISVCTAGGMGVTAILEAA